MAQWGNTPSPAADSQRSIIDVRIALISRPNIASQESQDSTMKFFPAAARIVFESPPFSAPAAGTGGAVRRRRGWEDDVATLPVTAEPARMELRRHLGPKLRVRT